MLIVLSPAKNLDYESALPTRKHTKAALLADAQELIEQLKPLAPHELSALMGISDKLGQLNFDRNQQWQLPFSMANARQALFAFKGDVYVGLDAYDFSEEDISFAQDHLRILSGLYGLLKPLDLMQPYRLEMGTRFENNRGKDLYQFWGDLITEQLNKQLKKLKQNQLVNLASNEYFKSVNNAALNAEIITPVFRDWKNDKYKIISFFAKKARGLMSAYIIKNKITDVAQIKGFDWEGYSYSEELSSSSEWVFTRKQ
ncbi:peroxide stress protein YaaA [Agarilytica rhodophyticola]|uniref:peroxide stress protein YaaA n=1 Tax=Agarilytica rhodophyticola TaxID=1737490 RepID=UPI000B347084|nr:peroxide stress protein YaaA [Agarilytica rhodophyticola]